WPPAGAQGAALRPVAAPAPPSGPGRGFVGPARPTDERDLLLPGGPVGPRLLAQRRSDRLGGADPGPPVAQARQHRCLLDRLRVLRRIPGPGPETRTAGAAGLSAGGAGGRKGGRPALPRAGRSEER